jgi:2',3'-cyclic nucleotide 3'-phosphodiesterase (fragment)
MQEYKELPDLSKEYSLDYCRYNQDDYLEFSYKGKKGHYEIGWKKGIHRGALIIDNKTYILHKEKYFSFNNVFTKDDLNMLMAIAHETVLREFPFKLDSGDIVTLRLPGDWLFDLGESILAFDKTAKIFYVKQGILYVDDKPVDVHTISKFYETGNNVYTYGLQTCRTRLCISSKFRACCKLEYLQDFLTRLPIKGGSCYVDICSGYVHIDNGLDYCDNVNQEVSAIPLNKITNYRICESEYETGNLIKFEVSAIEGVPKLFILMRGAPGSGKSTLIRNSRLSNYAISLDELRRLLAAEENGQLPTSVNKETYALLYSILQTRVQKGKLIILDAVNASIDHLKDSLDLAEQAGYRVVYYQMPTSLENCLENNLRRSIYSRASEEKIRRFHNIIETTHLPYERIYRLE